MLLYARVSYQVFHRKRRKAVFDKKKLEKINISNEEC